MIYYIEDEANQKDSLFVQNRPIPLTSKEFSNYKEKDSIVKAHTTPAYRDSLDREINRFQWSDFLGKTIQNSKKEVKYGFSIPTSAFHFNTVQGNNAKINLFYNRKWEKQKKSLRINAYNVYGFSDHKNYPGIQLDYLMDKVHYSKWLLRAERSLVQFDGESPIGLLMNSIYSLLLKENYAKWYENSKIEAHFSTFLSPEFWVTIAAAHFQRNPQGKIPPMWLTLTRIESISPIPPSMRNTISNSIPLIKLILYCNISLKTNFTSTPTKDFIPKRRTTLY